MATIIPELSGQWVLLYYLAERTSSRPKLRTLDILILNIRSTPKNPLYNISINRSITPLNLNNTSVRFIQERLNWKCN